jgi:hypothetical protein
LLRFKVNLFPVQKFRKYDQKVSSIVLNHCINSQSYIGLDCILSRNMIDINSSLDQYGWTVFHRAAYIKDCELMLIIMRYGM